VKSRIAWTSCAMLAKLAPAKAFRLKMPNQISTWLSQLARGWGEVKGNVGVCRQPVVVILVGGEVVEDDMDLPIGRLLGDQVGHKGLEIDAFLGLRGLSPNDAGGHFERSEQVDRAVPCRL
jgi:hypothetical protein